MKSRLGVLLLAGAALNAFAATPQPVSQRLITHVVVDFANLHKWDDSNGDTWDPFWAYDDNLYSFNCDGRGFGKAPRNLAFNEYTGSRLDLLTGSQINSMDAYGRAGDKRADGATWKVCGQECIDGVFYGFVVRNIYGNNSKDPLLRQTSFNASLIKSTDRGVTWIRPEPKNYDSPMWPGKRFGAPGFVHYGKNGGQVTQDAADRYVYAVSNNGFWNGGDDFVLGRVKRGDLPKLNAADWSYYTGGDGANDADWSPDLTRAMPVFSNPAKCGWTSPTYIAGLGRYVLVSWYVTPTLKKWFAPVEVKCDFYQAEHPWGPWTFIDSLSDHFLPPGHHFYGPNICAKYQQPEGSDVRVALFTSGCPFEDKPTGLYKGWEISLILKTTPEDHPPGVQQPSPRS